ncbi:MAG TPA: hypothetical protein PKE62_14330 [Anaerolineales bacterium]|nr:hypothetical protein [Anaerolineales bacterium]
MKRYFPQITLLLVAILAYGLLIPRLGFYWDDLPISWIRYQLGAEALTRYFSTNRPVWGLLYQVTTSVIPDEPIYWQIFALIWRWLGAVIVFAIVEKLWKGKPRLALGVALLFLVYPGFAQQWSAFLYSHFFIVLFFFLLSYLLMLRVMQEPNRYWKLTALGLLFSALNLWMMEYFYVLELMRVGVILTALRGEAMSLRERAMRTFKLWLPYLIVFILAILSRLFIFNNQVYGIGLGDSLKSAPLETIINLARNIRFTLTLVLRDAWMQVTQLPNIASAESILNSYYVVVALAVLVLVAGLLLTLREENPQQQDSRAQRRYFASLSMTSDSLWMIGLGIFTLLLSGWPFWLVGFVPSLAWPASRFTLPFMFGVSLLFAGIINLIPWERIRIALLVSLVAFAVGKQFLTANEYAQDWQTQKDLFWQLAWRAPSIAPDTAIIMNEGALEYYADNSLSPVVNWVYAPEKRGEDIDYVLLYPTTRLRSDALPKLEPDLPIFTEYLAGQFHGNTSQALAIYFMPPGCMRILDPDVDRVNRSIPEQSLMRFASRLTNYELISSESISQMPKPYYPEPTHGWCYYFQKADLARQFKQWDEVVSLGDAAFDEGLGPADPSERFVFIEGYAHVGDWSRAVELSAESFSESELMSAPLCRLWERVEAETAENAERDALSESKRIEALAEIWSLLTCNP